MVEVYFEKIRDVIKAELSMAKESIYIAVAWFTDRELFNALEEKSNEGVKIFLCITDDSINKKGSLLFENLVKNGGGFYKVKSVLMHNKFCVVDEKDSITGSYNWTYSASRTNHENIVLTTGDIALAARFIAEFNRISKRDNPTFRIETHLARFINRLEIISKLVALEEKEDIEKHAKRLALESNDEKLKEISETLLSGNYDKALSDISEFIRIYSAITIWNDPEIEELKLTIASYENSVLAIDNEIAEAEQTIKFYHKLAVEKLGREIEEVLSLKKEIAALKKDESKFNETKYAEAKAKYEKYKSDKIDAEKRAKEIKQISKEQMEVLKVAYREAVLKCHPDKVAGNQKVIASEAFIKLKDAYERQDIEVVKEISEQIKMGNFKIESVQTDDKLILNQHLENLKKKVELNLEALSYLKSNAAYKVSKQESDLNAHFESQRQTVLNDIETLKKELNALKA